MGYAGWDLSIREVSVCVFYAYIYTYTHSCINFLFEGVKSFFCDFTKQYFMHMSVLRGLPFCLLFFFKLLYSHQTCV